MRDKNYIPSRTSPKGGRRGCLCWDTNTYSVKCCDGSVHAQGVGSVYLTETTPAFSGILDTYSGAAAAYSLRQLSSTYTGSAIKVRRSSDNTTKDIGFVSNVLDTATLETFCSGTDGFVTTWYDQSGNAHNATETTASYQPKIVNNGSTILENSKPSIDFDDSGNRLRATGFDGSTLTNATQDIYLVMDYDNDTKAMSYYDLYTNNGSRYIGYVKQNDSGDAYRGVGTPTFYVNGDLKSIQTRGEAHTEFVSGQTQILRGDIGADLTTWEDLGFGLWFSGFAYRGTIQEWIIFDASTNRTGIETNINTHYSIY